MRASFDMSPEDVDAIAFAIARIFHTPLGELRAAAAADRAEHGGPPIVGAGGSPREQLQYLDRLVAAHETYWAEVAQHNPQSSPLREFLRRDWDPWFTYWAEARAQLDAARPYVDASGALREHPATDEVVVRLVREGAWGLHDQRAAAERHGIPMPEIGTALHALAPELVSGGWDDPRAVFDEGERQMSGSYFEVAAHAVASAQQQTPSPIYGYLRAGQQQHVYLFGTLDQAHGWLTALVQGEAPYDYAAVFAATDLTRPVPGLESFGHTVVSGASVGSVLPFLVGLPLGGLAGYFLRRWQEQNPGRTLPFVPPGKLPAPHIPPQAQASGAYVGGPWVDVESTYPTYVETSPHVGGPWLDVVGADPGFAAEVSTEDVDALAQELAAALGLAPEQVRAQLLEIARGLNISVGGPWVDLVSPYDNPWLASLASPSHARFADWIGAASGHPMHAPEHPYYAHPHYARPHYGAADVDRMRIWPQTRALIESAKREVGGYQATYPAAAWVWSLDPSGPSSLPGVELTGTTTVTPFASPDQALDYVRSRALTPHVALAMFDTASPHWPNPMTWSKSEDPAYAPIIAQHVAQGPQVAGDRGSTPIGAALDDVRGKAEALAARRAGNVVGVIHTSRDGLWHTLAFRSADDADDWLDTATQDPASYTYAAYFDKTGVTWPHAYIEKISGMRSPPGTMLPRRTTTMSGRWAA